MEQNVSKYPTLQRRLAVGFTVLGTVITAAIITILYSNFQQGLRDELRQRLGSITSIAALQQDGDLLLQVRSAEDEYYQLINEQNIKIKKADTDLVFVYAMMKNEQGIYFIVDAGIQGEEEGLAEFGSIYEEPSKTLVDNFDTIQQTIVEPDFYTDEYGTFLSAYAPILNSKGEKVGVLGVDIEASTVVAKERNFLILSILIFVLTVITIAISGLWLGRYFSTPIARLAEIARQIAEGQTETRAPETFRTQEVALLAKDFNTMTDSLKELIGSLEMRVEARTKELENTSEQQTKRAVQFQAVAQVAHSITEVKDFDILLPEITRLISERFGYYHVGIFLLDEENKFAFLRAANSQGGQAMLARKHKLRVGQEGIVGNAISRKKAYIASDVGGDHVFFSNPELPDTHSEMAIPLIVGNRAIGALDVQSKQSKGFTNEDIDVLTTLANLVAVAIENVRLFEQSTQTQKAMETLLRSYVQAEWQQLSEESPIKGYRAREIGLEPLTDINAASVQKKTADAILKIPVTLRDVTIGNLEVVMDKKIEEFTQEEKEIAQAVANRVALALENARLLQDSQRRAAKEQVIGEITSKIGASINLQSVLQTAVEELGRNIPGSEVLIQFQQENTDTAAKQSDNSQ